MSASPSPFIPGLRICPCWIDAAHEDALLRRLGGAGARVSDTQRNRIDRYGPGVLASGYHQGEVTTECMIAGDILPELAVIAARLVSEGIMAEPDAVTVNWFLPGQGMDRHTDRPEAGDVIAVLGLQGDATMELGRWQPQRVAMTFPFFRRTLVIMRDEARWQWEHAIKPVLEPRISIVFRRAAAR